MLSVNRHTGPFTDAHAVTVTQTHRHTDTEINTHTETETERQSQRRRQRQRDTDRDRGRQRETETARNRPSYRQHWHASQSSQNSDPYVQQSARSLYAHSSDEAIRLIYGCSDRKAPVTRTTLLTDLQASILLMANGLRANTPALYITATSVGMKRTPGSPWLTSPVLKPGQLHWPKTRSTFSGHALSG